MCVWGGGDPEAESQASTMAFLDLNNNEFAAAAARDSSNYNSTTDGRFGLHHFTYENNVLHRRIFQNFENLSFDGIVVCNW